MIYEFKEINTQIFYLSIYLSILIVSPAHAKKVNEKDALKVVSKALKVENKQTHEITKLIPMGLENDTLIYVAKLKKGGLIIVSGDDFTPPILGKSFKGEVNIDSLPGGLVFLIEKYKSQISALRKKGIKTSDDITAKWDYYLDKTTKSTSLKSTQATQSAGPLIGTIFNQKTNDNNYPSDWNRYCPYYCPAGCVAVAMAQILYYWNYDVDQTGSNTHDGMTVNFGNENYNWNMSCCEPDQYNSKLIYHAGISCNTDYTYNSSSASMSDARDGFVNYWGMSSDADYKWRIWYSTSSWKNYLKGDLDSGKPILYCGCEFAGDCHAWVIEGYDSNGDFYCNWGWGGKGPNGWFSLGDFTPDYDDLRALDYQERAIFNIHPATTVCSNISGPSTLTSAYTQYTIDNIADNLYATWQWSSNISSWYGSNHMIVLYAKSSGTGWIQASYNIGGTVVTSPKKYVTCAP